MSDIETMRQESVPDPDDLLGEDTNKGHTKKSTQE